MSDQLITKYRPQDWDYVYGHNEARASLQGAIKEGRSHCFLFTGPSGIGKTTLARLVAQSVGARAIEVDAGIYSGVDDARDLTEGLRYKLLEPRCYILNEVQMLTKRAWDSLLMSMEEPQEGLWFCLTTTDPSKVPPTVKTRCLTLNLKALDDDDLTDLLEAIRDAEGLRTSEDILVLCAKQAEGSPRLAISNYSLVLAAKDYEEAATLLEVAENPSEAIELIRALVDGAGWERIQPILNRLVETNPESVRHTALAYVTKAILGSKDVAKTSSLFQILDHFSGPFPDNEGMSPLILVVGRILFAQEI